MRRCGYGPKHTEFNEQVTQIRSAVLNFLGIGAQKCGTTWLYEVLSLHPQVCFPKGKEIHFWDQQRDRGIEWYRGLFATGSQSAVMGEITPAYAILAPAVIAEVAEAFPSIRLIFQMRSPIDRAWSSALMAMHRAELQIDEVSDRWFIDHFESRGSRNRSDYETCIRNWRMAYPANQLAFVRFEDIRSRPFDVYQNCCRHLGLEPIDSPQIRAKLNEVVFMGARAPIRPALREYLRDQYLGPIESLGRYLDLDLSSWSAL